MRKIPPRISGIDKGLMDGWIYMRKGDFIGMAGKDTEQFVS